MRHRHHRRKHGRRAGKKRNLSRKAMQQRRRSRANRKQGPAENAAHRLITAALIREKAEQRMIEAYLPIATFKARAHFLDLARARWQVLVDNGEIFMVDMAGPDPRTLLTALPRIGEQASKGS